MTASADRNAQVQELFKQWLTEAASKNSTSLPADSTLDLDVLFEVSQGSFRDLLATIVTARAIDSGYQASSALYSCKPRAIFELGIRPVLEANGIPCTQSGPLNVAKATVGIDRSWAGQRRPEKAASAVLRLVSLLEAGDSSVAYEVGIEVARRYLELAAEIKQLESSFGASANASTLSLMAAQMIDAEPDSGNTPQRFCSIALMVRFPEAEVYGQTDSAFTTNTTSRKPGDIGLIDRSGEIASVYEVTVKKFGAQRISECSQAIRAFNQLGDNRYPDFVSGGTAEPLTLVKVLCRKSDVPESVSISEFGAGGWIASAVDGEITYDFIDLFQWLSSQIFEMDQSAREQYFSLVQEYVNSPKTSKKVKQVFREMCNELKLSPS